jgi:hypothetical protein
MAAKTGCESKAQCVAWVVTMFDLWKEDLTEEEREQLLDKAAHEILKRKMEMPAVMFLEMHKPLANVGAHAMLAFSPFLVPFVGFDNLNNYSRLLAERGNVERLMQKLEKHGDEAVLHEEAGC